MTGLGKKGTFGRRWVSLTNIGFIGNEYGEKSDKMDKF